MLGWEFPPFITGGLGTACHGLTRALTAAGCRVTFVLPRAIEGSHASHVDFLSPESDPTGAPSAWIAPPTATVTPATTLDQSAPRDDESDRVEREFRAADLLAGTPARIDILRTRSMAMGSYGAGPRTHTRSEFAELRALVRASIKGLTTGEDQLSTREALSLLTPDEIDTLVANAPTRSALRNAIEALEMERALPEAAQRDTQPRDSVPMGGYDGDLILAAERYAHFCVRAAQGIPFDVIHAHDWLTYPAGIALARLTGRPLIVHVHATEFDRSGDHVSQSVYNIERRGMHAAVRVIAVSMLTRNLLVNRYGVSPDKIDVVYNGVDLEPAAYGIKRIERSERIVLYFGRITMQKGPEYFVRAAKRVLEVEKSVRFVVAGSGDQAASMIEMAAALGIGGKMTFTGFLRGKDIQRVFSMADLYVMPSVSEPFGIAPLEAMGHRVPVIISRNSGVSEVLTHALKVNFWDVDEMANKIVAVLRHPPLRAELRDRGWFEVRGITWDGAAKRCLLTYSLALDAIARTRRFVPSRPRSS